MIVLALSLMIQEAGPTGRHIECLATNMAQFEASGEAPQDIAIAALTTCRSSESKMDTGALANLSPEQRDDLRDFLRETMRERIVTHVVRLRACRKTEGCRVTDLPAPFGPL